MATSVGGDGLRGRRPEAGEDFGHVVEVALKQKLQVTSHCAEGEKKCRGKW